jgi:hypothetical protein
MVKVKRKQENRARIWQVVFPKTDILQKNNNAWNSTNI